MPCKLRQTKRSAKHREIEGGSDNIQKSKHACIVETHESTRKRLEGTIKRSRRSHCGQGVQIVESLKSCGQVCSYAPSNENPGSNRSSGQGIGEARKVAGVANDQSKEQNGGHSGSTKRAKNFPFCYAEWTSVISRMPIWNQSVRRQRRGRGPR